MSQVDEYTIPGSPLTMIGLATRLESIFGAVGSSNRGELSPDNAFEGMLWWDASATPIEVLKRFTVDAGWVELVSVNISTGAVNFIASVGKTIDTGSAKIPVGTSAQRDVAAQSGYFRFNSDTSSFEGYDGSLWRSVVQLEDVDGVPGLPAVDGSQLTGSVVQLEDVGGVPGLPAVDGSQLTGIAAGSGVPIGGTVMVQTHLTGAEEPDPEMYIKLEAGLTGVGGYNEGKLTNENVSGSAPLVVATAEISDSESPMFGQVVNLWMTEGRYPKPGTTPGTVAFDQMQQITGFVSQHIPREPGISFDGAFSGSSVSVHSPFGTVGSGYRVISLDFDSANSPNARTSDTTDVKHEQVAVYLRIK